tara:strand:+ start:16735 stop:17058 length:324 start_codon:yes stop_codon:yes gene_type:complete
MNELLLLFAMYGIAFGLQHKLPGAWSGTLNKVFQKGFLETLLTCTYCVGFHAGWIIYLCSISGGEKSFSIGYLIVYAFAGASFSYSIDAYVQNLEEGEGDYEDSEEG